MAFFGIDQSFPAGKAGASKPKGMFDHQDPFAKIANDRKLQAFQGQDNEILDFEETYDGLGDQLEEDNDDFNDDTFGGGEVGKDFDFAGATAQVGNAPQQQKPVQPQYAAPPISTRPKKTGYERYKDPGFMPEIGAKSNVWGSKPQQQAVLPESELISTARPSATQPTRKMMSLEEVEAAIRAQSMPPQPPPSQYQPQYQFQHEPSSFPTYTPPPTYPVQQQAPQQIPQPAMHHQRGPSQSNQGPQQPLQILQNPNRARHSPQPNAEQVPKPMQMPSTDASMPIITNPQQLLQLSEEQRQRYLDEDAKRAKRNHKIFLLSKGNGLMTPQDKNFITRIQLQQLVTATGNAGDSSPEAALAEDFYYQVFSQIKGAPRQHPTQPLGHFAQTYLLQTGGRMNNRKNAANGDNHMQRMQAQVQRAVEAAKAKPKNKQLIIEGSLGKISFSNAKTPKPLLNIKKIENERPGSARKVPHEVNVSDRKAILRNIETVYTTLMQMEDHERQQPPPPTEGDTQATAAHMEWRAKMQTLLARLWEELKVLEPINPGSSIPHPFIAFLSFSKGKKAIPRVFRFIDTEQRVTILTMITVHLDQLDVIRLAQIPLGESQPNAAVRAEIDLFSNAVMPSLLGYVSEAPIAIMIGLLGLVLDHTNLIQIARTKIGLGILTMFLSRAELLRESGVVPDADWQQWTQLYNRMFDTLEAVLGSIFPNAVSAGDDMYVWQFLASAGVGASPEQQQRLVIAVKDRVMETVISSKTLPPEMSSQRLGNVNLFMRAIGLDVEMLG